MNKYTTNKDESEISPNLLGLKKQKILQSLNLKDLCMLNYFFPVN